MKVIDDKDPYESVKMGLSADMTDWHEMTYPDIVNYVVYKQSPYKLTELEAAYTSFLYNNYFISGFVQGIEHCLFIGKRFFLGKVKHSQR